MNPVLILAAGVAALGVAALAGGGRSPAFRTGNITVDGRTYRYEAQPPMDSFIWALVYRNDKLLMSVAMPVAGKVVFLDAADELTDINTINQAMADLGIKPRPETF